MLHIDHFNLTANNVFEASHKLREETGIGFYDGGLIGATGVNFIFPLGDDTYIEVNGIVNAFAVEDPSKRSPVWDKIAKEPRWMGACLRTDTMEEMQEISKRLNMPISNGPVRRFRPDGPPVQAPAVPSAMDCWAKGLPNWYCHEDRINRHPSGQPAAPGPNYAQPLGLAWCEMGGTDDWMAKWLGDSPAKYKIRLNGKAPGLYAVAVKTAKGEIVIRRKPQQEP